MGEPRHTPSEIGPSEDATRLRILWEDGVESTFVPRELRVACPCAGCVDEMTGRRTLLPESVPQDLYPAAIHYVGRYALQFVWSDGHQTGIYPFAYLRRLADDG
jgi:DUF971 family protein